MSMSTGQSGYASQPYGAPAQPAPPAVWPPQDPHVPPALTHPPLGRRAGAYAIDAVILWIVNVVAAIIVLMIVRTPVVMALVGGQPFPIWTVPVLMIPGVVALASALTYSAMQGSGGSVGQRMLGIRLVHADTGARLGFWRAVWRNIVWGATCAIIVGYFTPLFDSSPRRRGWHDLASGAVMTVRGSAGVGQQGQAADLRQPAQEQAQSEYAVPGAAPADAYAAPSQPAPIDPFAAPSSPAPMDPFAAPAGAPATAADPAPAPSEAAPAPIDPFEVPAAPPAPPAPAAPPVVPPMPAPPAPPAREAAPAAPAAPEPTSDGPIAFVPGVTGERDEQPQAAPIAPVPPAPDPAPVAEPVPAPDPAPVAEPVSAPDPEPQPAPAPAAPDFPDDTIVLNHAPAPTNVPSVILVWDDGTRTEVTSRTVFGRNPSPTEGADVVAIPDDTLSLSKTHFEISLENGSASIVDRHSTNGVVVARGGTSTTLVPDSAAPLAAGDQITIGDRHASVEKAGKS